MEATGQPHSYSHPERMRVIYGVLLCVLLAALDQTVVLPAIPQMAVTLHGHAHLSWVVSAYLLTATATTPIYGKLSDLFGRAQILLPCLALFMLASVFCAMAGTLPELLAARALQGVGGGALMAVAQAAVGDVVPGRERGRYQGWFAAMWALASGAGPVAGGYITQHATWRWIFWANLPLGLLAMALVTYGLRKLPAHGRGGRVDITGALLLMGAVTLLLAALSLGGTDLRWLSWGEAGLVALGAGGLALFAWQQRRHPAPLLPGALARRLRFVIALAWLNTAGMFATIFLMPLLLQRFHHADPAGAGVALVPFLLAGVGGAYGGGQAIRRFGTVRLVLGVALGLSAVSFAALAASPLFAPVLISGVLGFGLGVLNPATLFAAQSLANPPEMGVATGMLLLLRSMGGAFGATLAGAALDVAGVNALNGFRVAFFACLILTLLALGVLARMPTLKLRS